MDDDKELLMSQMNFEKKFGQSAIFVTSTLMEEGGVPPSSSPAALLKEAIHVISCGYEDKTEWGLEVKFMNYLLHREVICPYIFVFPVPCSSTGLNQTGPALGPFQDSNLGIGLVFNG